MKAKVLQNLWNCTHGKNCSDAMDGRWGWMPTMCEALWAPGIQSGKETCNIEQHSSGRDTCTCQLLKNAVNFAWLFHLHRKCGLQSAPLPTIPYCFTLYLLHSTCYLPEPHGLFSLWPLVSNVPGLLVTLALLKTTEWPKDYLEDPILGLIWGDLGPWPCSPCPHP